MAKKRDNEIQHPDYEKAPMTRRQLLKRAGTAAGLAGGVSYLSLAPANWPLSLKDRTGLRSKPEHTAIKLDNYTVEKAPNAADVGVARGTRGPDGEYSKEQIANLFRAAIDQVTGNKGLKHFIKPGDIVLVKPNVAFDRSPNLGATSNPVILETLIRMILEDCKAQEVRVADNPIESPPDCFRKSKVEEATLKGGGRVYLPDSTSFKRVNTPGAQLIEEWWFFHRPFTNVDKVIGLAPVKDHNLCHASMGIKNWYGLLGGTRNQFHQDINGIVSDLSMMIKPTLTILDGTNVLMQNGPTGGDPTNVKKGDVIMAGIDPVALDTYAFEHVLERGKDFPAYLKMAQDKGSGNMDYTGRIRELQI
jgi:uncharacterized protein (DUF362 family)